MEKIALIKKTKKSSRLSTFRSRLISLNKSKQCKREKALVGRQPAYRTPTRRLRRALSAGGRVRTKGVITSKLKHAIKLKQVMQDLHNCCATVAALISILF